MGQSHSVSADDCTVPINCTVEFDDSGQVLRAGGYEPGKFPGDPDVAGVGVCMRPEVESLPTLADDVIVIIGDSSLFRNCHSYGYYITWLLLLHIIRALQTAKRA